MNDEDYILQRILRSFILKFTFYSFWTKFHKVENISGNLGSGRLCWKLLNFMFYGHSSLKWRWMVLGC